MKRNEWLWIYWPAALLFIALILFAVPEFIAIKDGGPTFSLFMWTMSKDWPLWTFLWGVLVGGLAVHFLWHWDPDGKGDRG
jgi:uncharacterized integral membrane protein